MATLKDALAASASFTITLGGLANGSARQSTEIDNTTNLYVGAYVACNIKLGTSPTSNTIISVYILRNDNNATPIRDDAAGASDAAITIKNATLIGTLTTGGSAATGDVLKGVFYVDNLGPKWSIAIKNDTGVALDATNGNHVVNYVGVTKTIV